MQTTTRWSFTTFFNGVRGRSPRVFDTKEEAIQAIVEKLSMQALDGEYPCVGLVAITTPQVKNEQTDSGIRIATIPDAHN